MFKPWVHWIALTGALLGGPACDSDGGSEDVDTASTEPCEGDQRGDVYAVGLARFGEVFTVEFVDAVPAPPGRGDNIWHVRVADAAGAPVEGVEFEVIPFMPDHDHGTPVEAFAEPVEGVPGEYRLHDVNLFMAGLWEVEVNMSLAEAVTDSVLFKFCINP